MSSPKAFVTDVVSALLHGFYRFTTQMDVIGSQPSLIAVAFLFPEIFISLAFVHMNTELYWWFIIIPCWRWRDIVLVFSVHPSGDKSQKMVLNCWIVLVLRPAGIWLYYLWEGYLAVLFTWRCELFFMLLGTRWRNGKWGRGAGCWW